MSRPLGCMTTSGFIAGFIALILVAVATALSGQTILSPGELNAEKSALPLSGVSSHAEVTRQCAACHTPFWSSERMGHRCISCHTNLPEEFRNEGSLHFGFASPDNCTSCHTDHNGSDANLTRSEMDDFNHAQTGFYLTAHESLISKGSIFCGKCHAVSFGNFDEAVCTSCHMEDAPNFLTHHVREFGDTCLGCHDGVETYGASFSHEVKFDLAGEHDDLSCSACHVQQQDLASLQTTPTECEACHLKDNVHSQSISESCGDCHSPSGWEEAEFDHALSGYRLIGSHIEVMCEECHLDRQWRGIPRICEQCHLADDVHEGQFDISCEQCHQPTDWEETIFDHAQTVFPLDGAHLQVSCVDCHPAGAYVGTSTQCFACHEQDDQHGGRFGMDCTLCHTTADWSEVTFDHSLSAFPLTGAHISLQCQQCHMDQQFAGTPRRCAGCHSEPAFHAGLFGTDCAACHSTSAWRPAAFNGPHSFPLNHGGAGSNCATCHPSGYTSYTCYGCHEHNQSEIAKKHQEEGINNFSNCVRCHPTGHEEGGDDD